MNVTKQVIRLILLSVTVCCTSVNAQTYQAVVVDTCPITDSTNKINKQSIGVALMGSLATNVAKGLVNAAGVALTKAAEPKTTTVAVDPTVEKFYKVSTKDGLMFGLEGKCLIVYSLGATPSEYASAKTSDRLLSRLKESVRTKAIEGNGTVKLYLELRIAQLAADSEGFHLEPRYFYTSEFLETGWTRSDRRDQVFTVSFAATSDGVSFANATFSMTNTREGVPYGKCEDNSFDKSLCPAAQNVGFKESRSAFLKFMPKGDAVDKAIEEQERILTPYLQVEAALNAKPETLQVARSDLDQRVVVAREAYCKELKTAKVTGFVSASALEPTCAPSLTIAKEALDKIIVQTESRNSATWARKRALDLCRINFENWDKAVAKTTPLSCEPAENASKAVGSVEISITLAETANAAKWLQIFAKAFNDSKEDLNQAITTSLDREGRSTAAATAAESLKEAQDAARLSLIDVKISEQNLAESTSTSASARTALEKSVISAKLNANKLHRKLKPVPFMPFPEVE
jgi:hypothetical protein